MKKLTLIIALVFVSFLGSTTSTIAKVEAVNGIATSNAMCCWYAYTETRYIEACSDQGCQAAFEIFKEMHSW